VRAPREFNSLLLILYPVLRQDFTMQKRAICPGFRSAYLPQLAFIILMPCGTAAEAAAQGPGAFEASTDVGQISRPGEATFDAAKGEYRITGSGANIWGTVDAFQFVWKKVSGDVELSARVSWQGEGKNAHRKAGWMVRQDLEPDSPYADAVVHGDGLISLQFRRVRSGPTLEVKSAIKAPAVIKLERNGGLFTLSVAPDGEAYRPAGAVTVALPGLVHTGLVVCSHDAGVSEAAIFKDIVFKSEPAGASQKRVLESTFETLAIETGIRRIIYRAKEHFEAPNWSRDGRTFYFNRGGRIYSLPTDGGTPVQLDTGSADRCNNDHGLSPDGRLLAISHTDPALRQSIISLVPISGGAPKRITPLGPSYWHGWSPDGQTVAYCAQRNGEFDIYTIGVSGGAETRLTTASGLDDGPDYSADGKHIYFNSERSGTMKIWRMDADGTNQKQLSSGAEFADWFPHPSPDGKWLVFLSYDSTVKGHPAEKDVMLRIMPSGGGAPRVLATLFGGQGTINVPSWSPDSKHVAFVSYRKVSP
jgi:Tol biopolymer transport system component